MLIIEKKDRFRVQSISLPDRLIKEVDKILRHYQMTKSEAYRRAIELYIHKLNWDKLREYGASQAVKMGITNEDQVVKLIKELRTEKKPK